MPEINVNQTLALNKAMKEKMDNIVKAATQAALLLEGCKNFQKNQIRNVLNVAGESKNVAVVANFIRYQIGRSNTGPDWQHNGFGLHVIEDITGSNAPVRQTLDKVLQSVSEQIGEDAVTDELRRQAHVDLMRYYLGYLNRVFIFGSNEKIENGWQQLKQALEVWDV